MITLCFSASRRVLSRRQWLEPPSRFGATPPVTMIPALSSTFCKVFVKRAKPLWLPRDSYTEAMFGFVEWCDPDSGGPSVADNVDVFRSPYDPFSRSDDPVCHILPQGAQSFGRACLRASTPRVSEAGPRHGPAITRSMSQPNAIHGVPSVQISYGSFVQRSREEEPKVRPLEVLSD